MVRVNKSCFVLLGVASSISLAIDAVAQNSSLVNQIEQQVESLKTQLPTENEDEAFQIEQAEFDRLRQQLLETEQSILEGSTPTSEATTDQISAETQPAEPSGAGNILEASTVKEPVVATDAANLFHEVNAESELEASDKTTITKSSNLKELKSLEKELQDTRNKLLIAETELERLNAMISSQNTNRQAAPSNTDSSAIIFSTAKARAQAGSPDATIVTVVTDTATLRTGPSEASTKIMDIDNGQRLKVDDRQGNWFRISTNSGMRAWVAVSEVAFGPSESSSPSATIKIKPVSSAQQEEDDRAFALIKNHTASN